MSFNALNRVTTITHLGTANQTLASLSYTLDDTGRRTAITESNGRSSAYTYDELYRLTSESIIDPQVGNHSASFEYNAVSDRISDTVNGITTGYTFDDNDRLTANGINTYTYDDNGNTVSEVVDGQSNSYGYDSQNRLIQAGMGGVVQAMSYDPDGIRIEKSLGGVTTDYLTDTNQAYAQVLHESTPTTGLQYTFGLDLVGMNTGTENFTYHSDALGSTRLLTNTAGQVADDVRYDAWGEQLAGGDVAENQYLYTGEQFDSQLDKVYLRARYYAPGVGRFSQMDTFNGFSGNAITQNKYLYGNGNPSNMVDSSGNVSIGSIMAGLAGAGRVALSSAGKIGSVFGTAVRGSGSAAHGVSIVLQRSASLLKHVARKCSKAKNKLCNYAKGYIQSRLKMRTLLARTPNSARNRKKDRVYYIVGAWDIGKGVGVAAFNGNTAGTLPKGLKTHLMKFGLSQDMKRACGTKNTVGRCAEFRAAKKLTRFGAKVKDIRWTFAYRVNKGPNGYTTRGDRADYCDVCTAMFPLSNPK